MLISSQSGNSISIKLKTNKLTLILNLD